MEVDLFRLFVFVSAVCVLWYWSKKYKTVSAAFPLSDIRLLPVKKSLKSKVALTMEPFFWLATLFLAVALSDPRKSSAEGIQGKRLPPRSGIGIYFLLDYSGSMDEKVKIEEGQMRKIDLAKKAIREFLKESEKMSGRADDLFGLVAFARVANVVCPLTLDRHVVLSKLASLEPIKEERLNGTAIGYAIFKTVKVIEATKYFAERQKEMKTPTYLIKNQVIIVITDGLQSPHPDDKSNPFRYIGLDEALAYAKENEVRVYFIGVDPIFAKSEFANEVEQLRKATVATGGAFFLATGAFPIEEIFSKIDSLEKSELPQMIVQTKPKGESLIFECIIGALFCLCIAMLVETVCVRSVP